MWYGLIQRKRSVYGQLYTAFLRRMFSHVGHNCFLDPTIWYEYPDKIHLEDDVEIRRGAILIARSDSDVGIFMDTGVHIHQYAYLDAYGGFIKLGKGVRIGHHSVIAGHGGVVFGDHSGVAGLSYVISSNHVYEGSERPHVENEVQKASVRFGENVWGASGIIVTAGVTIGDNVVIGAGSVVRRDVPDNAVVMGNPARVAFYHD